MARQSTRLDRYNLAAVIKRCSVGGPISSYIILIFLGLKNDIYIYVNSLMTNGPPLKFIGRETNRDIKGSSFRIGK